MNLRQINKSLVIVGPLILVAIPVLLLAHGGGLSRAVNMRIRDGETLHRCASPVAVPCQLTSERNWAVTQGIWALAFHLES